MKNNSLAIFGGSPVREKEFGSKPYITPEMITNVGELMNEGRFSKFIGSPIPGTKELLELTSQELLDVEDITSFLGGPSVRKLEANWAKHHKCKYAISVNSCTSGLITAVMALNVGPGDEVICSPFSFTASATAIVLSNAIPVFVDVDLDTFCLSSDLIGDRITESTRAIMPIHWNSNAGDFASILDQAKTHNLKIIEDAAQAPGELYQDQYLGTLGDVGVYSLNEPKNIMTGEGGIIVTNDREVAKKCRLIRNHGEAIVDEDTSDIAATNIVGYNFRLVEILAEIGILQLDNLPFLNDIRRKNYQYLVSKLTESCGAFLIPQKITNSESYFPYSMGFRWLSEKSEIHRDVIAKVLRSEGIPVATGVSRLMSDHPMFQKKIAYGTGHCPFSCHLYKGKETYTIPELPNAKRLQEEEYLGFFQVGWPCTTDDMNDIVTVFQKILDNRTLLKEESINETGNVFISGR